jgi:hypothetical protein
VVTPRHAASVYPLEAGSARFSAFLRPCGHRGSQTQEPVNPRRPEGPAIPRADSAANGPSAPPKPAAFMGRRFRLHTCR